LNEGDEFDVNVYYTEGEITDLPAYLDEKYVEYEIKVEKKTR
jgi:hypothetical protein